GRRAAGEPQCAEAGVRIEKATRLGGPQLGGEVRENHDWKLEALRFVRRHEPHAVGALLENRRFLRAAALSLLIELFEEPTERDPALALVLSREIRHAQDIGQHLLTAL